MKDTATCEDYLNESQKLFDKNDFEGALELAHEATAMLIDDLIAQGEKEEEVETHHTLAPYYFLIGSCYFELFMADDSLLINPTEEEAQMISNAFAKLGGEEEEEEEDLEEEDEEDQEAEAEEEEEEDYSNPEHAFTYLELARVALTKKAGNLGRSSLYHLELLTKIHYKIAQIYDDCGESAEADVEYASMIKCIHEMNELLVRVEMEPKYDLLADACMKRFEVCATRFHALARQKEVGEQKEGFEAEESSLRENMNRLSDEICEAINLHVAMLIKKRDSLSFLHILKRKHLNNEIKEWSESVAQFNENVQNYQEVFKNHKDLDISVARSEEDVEIVSPKKKQRRN